MILALGLGLVVLGLLVLLMLSWRGCEMLFDVVLLDGVVSLVVVLLEFLMLSSIVSFVVELIAVMAFAPSVPDGTHWASPVTLDGDLLLNLCCWIGYSEVRVPGLGEY